jgi:hypothetical protein
MKKTLLLILVIIASVISQAQVAAVLFPSVAKQFYIDDVWKTTFINTSTSTINVVVQFQVSEANKSSSNVLTINTHVLTFSPGANHITAAEGAAGKWIYGGNEQGSILQATGKLPYGTYLFCARIFAATTNKSLGENCNEDLEVAPMLPPQLSFPANGDTVTMNYPVLTWIPPRPLSGLNITYSLVLTKIEGSESPSQALLQNPPLINLSNLSNTNLTYPATAPALQPGVNYAWQVAASYEGYSLGTTDVWIFTLKPPPPPPSDIVIYPVANKISDGHYYVTRGILRFAYINKANDKKLKYVIKVMGKKENLKRLPEVSINPGTNKLQVDLRKNAGLKKDQYYDLQITDSKGQVYKLLYYYIND